MLCDILGSKINLGDDIQSPLTKVGIEKRVPTGKAASHHISHKSMAWSVGTNYTKKSKSHSTPAHQQFGTHVSNLQKREFWLRRLGYSSFQSVSTYLDRKGRLGAWL